MSVRLPHKDIVITVLGFNCLVVYVYRDLFVVTAKSHNVELTKPVVTAVARLSYEFAGALQKLLPRVNRIHPDKSFTTKFIASPSQAVVVQ